MHRSDIDMHLSDIGVYSITIFTCSPIDSSLADILEIGFNLDTTSIVMEYSLDPDSILYTQIIYLCSDEFVVHPDPVKVAA